jgi:pyruvate dehydrogenase E1 component beta subunit
MMTKLKYREALRDALREEMARDPTVFCIGEGIGERGGSYKVTEGLIAEFGPGRVVDTPLSEAGFVGLGTGAAIAGGRPVVEMLFIDFLLLAMDQVVNQAAKYRFMSGGQGNVPLVIRTQGGAGNSLAGQHSQSLEAIFHHIPGLKVVMPSTPADAKGLLKTAIRDDDPVIFIEHKLLYMTDGEVPAEPYVIPLGQAEVKRPGTDVTLVTWSHMTIKSLQAAEELAGEGISAEVIDLRTLVPMDTETVLESVSRTGHLVIAQEAVKRGGVGSDVAAIVAERAFDSLRAPIVRVAAETVIRST